MSIVGNYVARAGDWVSLTGGTTISPRGEGAGNLSVLLVTENGTLGVGEPELRDILINEGHTVTVRGINDAEDYTGIDVVLVSYGGTNNDNGMYKHPPVGVVCRDSWRSLGMGTSLGYASSVNNVEVVDSVNALAGGVTGTYSLYASPQYITWDSELPINADIVVTRPSMPGQAVVFGYEAGETMPGRFATTRHVALGFHRDGFVAGLTADAKAQVRAAVAWAAASTYVAPPAPLAPSGVSAAPGDTQVTVSWTAPDYAETYTVKRAEVTGGPYTTVGTTTSTSFTDTGLTNGTEYFYVVSASNASGTSADSVEVSATPEVVVLSTRFLYSDAQVTEFRNRMTGAGPFYSTEQGFYGPQTNAPGDGERAFNHANNFIASPTVSRWALPVPLAEGNPWPGGSGSGITPDEAMRPLRAAWCYLTMPNHASNATWRAEAKAWLLWNARHANHDFANSTNWWIDYPGYQPSPIFAYAGWAHRLLRTYDMLGRDSFTSAELTELDHWFYTWANFILHHIDNQTTKDRMEPSSTYGTGLTAYRAYDGGDYISNWGVLTNRSMACIGSGSAIAHYLHYHGSTPDTTSGTQPAYGWWTVEQMRNFTRSVAEAWVRYSLHPDGWCYDFHRAQLGTASPQQGWAYAANELVHAVVEAKWWARNGDDTLWQYATTDGRSNTAGIPTAGGFTAKNLQYAAWMHARYVNDGWGRVVTTELGTGPLADPNKAQRDTLNSAIVSQRYPDDSLLKSSWTRADNSFPDYPSSPETQGSWNVRDGEHAKYMGLIELGGV